MSLNKCVPLLNCSDLARSISFYVDGLGFKMTNQWAPEGTIRWCNLERGNVAFMLQAARDPIPKPEGWSLCVFCDDAIALYHEFVARDIDVVEPFVGNRLWVTTVTDPDGYRIEFESPTDVPEETRLSDLD